MKMPTAKGWLAIAAALAALILAALAALADGNLTADETKALTEKAGGIIEAVQEATQKPQEAPTEAAP